MRKPRNHRRLAAAAIIALGTGAAISSEAGATTLTNPLYVTYGSSIIAYSTSGVAVGTQSTDTTTPYGTAFDSSGNLYWSDYTTGKIYESAGGTIPNATPTTFYTPPSGAPLGIAFDSHGSLYAAGYTSNDVFEVTGGSLAKTFNVGANAWDVAVDPTGNVWVTSKAGTVYEFAGSATSSPTARSIGATDEGIVTDSSGNVFVLSNSSTTNTIYELNASEAYSVSTFATVKGNSGTVEGLAFDSSGNLYAAGENTAGTAQCIWQIGAAGSTMTPVDDIDVGGANLRFFGFDNAAVPEPASIGALGVVGAASLLKRPRRRRRR